MSEVCVPYYKPSFTTASIVCPHVRVLTHRVPVSFKIPMQIPFGVRDCKQLEQAQSYYAERKRRYLRVFFSYLKQYSKRFRSFLLILVRWKLLIKSCCILPVFCVNLGRACCIQFHLCD